MQYYICDKEKLKEVSEEEYETWRTTEKDKFILPEVATIINGDFYGLETMYVGAVDKGEGPYPFILLYFEDKATVKSDKIEVDMEANTVDYFETFKELKDRYNELLHEINMKKILEN